MRATDTLKALLMSALFMLAACGGGGGGSPSTIGAYNLTVHESDGTTPVADARVDIFDAGNHFVAAATSGVDGAVGFSLEAGVYGAHVSAQGFAASPPQGIGATPFTVTANQTLTASINLDSSVDPAAFAMIHGNADVAGVLVVAEDAAQGVASSGLSDTNGNYVLFNVLPGDYQVTAFRAGYLANTVAQTVAALDDATVDLDVVAFASAALGGQLTFLATSNGVVDITLLHPVTRDTIPGLGTMNVGTTYSLANVPAGKYLAWATFANDGYVMDPDWVNKNGGYPAALEVTMTNSPQTMNFSVTDAVTLVSPTNAADLVVPTIIHTLTPTFSWLSYPSAQEYVVEVSDLKGNPVWGGYVFDPVTQTSTFNHPAIGTATSAAFNFDSSAATPLVDGQTYLWRVHAFKWNTSRGGFVAISSSEQQMGLLKIELPTP